MRILWIIGIALLGAVTGWAVTRLEGTPPAIQTRTAAVSVGAEHTQEILISDDGTGVASVRVWLETTAGEQELVAQGFPGNLVFGADLNVERALEVSIRPKDLGLADGPGTLHVEALDFSWRGNRSAVEVPVAIDTRPPRIAVQTGLTYVRRGGTELVVYRVDEDAKTHGVELGTLFFRGFPHPSDPSLRLAFYALTHDAPPAERPRVVATDEAGNRASAGINVSVIERGFPEDQIQLSLDFMQRKAEEISGSANGDPLAAYLKINGELRVQNDEEIRKVCQSSSDDQLWQGPFLQLPNSQVGARFAERRSYLYEGKVVDRQVHLGYDLATTSSSPVAAANDGVVAFAGPLGIYGNTVILDHGLGLSSLYGHLSEVSVEKGRAVSKGHEIGRTGQTGLAGGDHLHYSMMIDGIFVDPVEWFDGKWIQEHIQPKLAGPGAT